MALQELGRMIIFLGLILVLVGMLLWFSGSKIPFLGNMPGDILIKREKFSFYAPITTMLLVSIIFSVILTIIANLKK